MVRKLDQFLRFFAGGSDRIELVSLFANFTLSLLTSLFLSPLLRSLNLSIFQFFVQFFLTYPLIARLRKAIGSGRFRELLYRNQTIIEKESFQLAPPPLGYHGWEEYFTSRLIHTGLAPIAYPLGKTQAVNIPAYEVINFANGTQNTKPNFVKEKFDRENEADPRLFFTHRLDRGNRDSQNHFMKSEIIAFAQKTNRRIIEDTPAIALTDLKFSQQRLTELHYAHIPYLNLYLLVNQVGYMAGRFEREKEAGLPFPIEIMDSHLIDFKNHDYSIFSEIPAILGVEIFLVTADNKLILQISSRERAVYSDKLTSSVSAGYEPNRSTGNFEGWMDGALEEAKNELMIPREAIEKFELVALVHIPPSNEFNFVVYARTRYDYAKVNMNVEEARKTKSYEVWEHKKLIPFPVEEIVFFNGNWSKFFEKNRDNADRAIVALHYCAKYFQEMKEACTGTLS